ncbi:hypothetical protein [Tateyamaria sp. SN6-1]|uniref:hypothetical protein n=1 Tax=Tateyamaria sp. SN6-1 TaxID=3092148 RepID=UPI0039F587AB
MKPTNTTLLAFFASTAFAFPAVADQVFTDDLIVQGSACVGLDCNNGESFGFDTIRMKENNLRLHFDDTSNSASFPSNDWRIGANDTSNGGANKLFLEDSTAGRQIVVFESGAPANAMVLDSSGNLALGTANPVVEMHVVDGDSPTLRLEQDGSSGFTPQTFDIASNEANFFVRDVTNGSQLPFKIIPGADSNSLVLAANNNVGMGTQSPSAKLHVVESANLTGATAHAIVQNSNSSVAQRTLLTLQNNGGSQIIMENTSTATDWRMAVRNADNDFAIFASGGIGTALRINDVTGDLQVTGTISSAGTTLAVPDYVFEDDYELMPLAEVEAYIDENGHLPRIPSASDVKANGLNMSHMQMSLLEKIEELTLYTLAQEKQINALQDRISVLQ